MAAETVLRKSTPVLGVERVEPIIVFWGKLGLIPTPEVPDLKATDGRLAFVLFAQDGLEIMYQSFSSLQDDLWNAASEKEAFWRAPQQATLFVEVSDLATVAQQLSGEQLIMPRRKTSYGSTEIGYADPAGNVIIFAQHDAESSGQ